MMVGSSRDWSEFIASLNRHRVRFIIVGAHALAVLGRPRHTGDLDVFVQPTTANAEKVADALRDFGFEGAANAAWELVEPSKMMTLGREPVRIDITSEMSDLTFEEAWKSRIRRRIGGYVVAFLGRAAYIKNKRAAAQLPSRRAKDLHDIDMLEGLSRRRRRRR
jgi:predicted nucleotidyltransferase